MKCRVPTLQGDKFDYIIVSHKNCVYFNSPRQKPDEERADSRPPFDKDTSMRLFRHFSMKRLELLA